MPQSDNNATINNDELNLVVEEASKEIADLYVKFFGLDFAGEIQIRNRGKRLVCKPVTAILRLVDLVKFTDGKTPRARRYKLAK